MSNEDIYDDIILELHSRGIGASIRNVDNAGRVVDSDVKRAMRSMPEWKGG